MVSRNWVTRRYLSLCGFSNLRFVVRGKEGGGWSNCSLWHLADWHWERTTNKSCQLCFPGPDSRLKRERKVICDEDYFHLTFPVVVSFHSSNMKMIIIVHSTLTAIQISSKNADFRKSRLSTTRIATLLNMARSNGQSVGSFAEQTILHVEIVRTNQV